MNTKTFLRNPVYVLVLVILVAASFLAGDAASKGRPVKAQVGDASAVLAAPAAGEWHTCTIENINVTPENIRLKCLNGAGWPNQTIIYFQAMTVSTADSRLANRYLATLFSAFALNKEPLLMYETDASKNPPGCDSSNCRKIVLVVLAK